MTMLYKVTRSRKDLFLERRNNLEKRIRDSQRVLVRCVSCGRLDNDWPPRHGLCCRCWCGLLHARLMSGMSLEEAEADAAKAAESIAEKQKERKEL